MEESGGGVGIGYLRPDQFLDHLTVIKTAMLVGAGSLTSKGQNQKPQLLAVFRKNEILLFLCETKTCNKTQVQL